MKIEMGESLIYSWLRHVKQCQIVQTNWKPSAQWTLNHQADLQLIMKAVSARFPASAGYTVFGTSKPVTLQQFIMQAEIDVFGSLYLGHKIYAVDVAFHENGLGYGSSIENASRIIKKCLRAAMCIYGYFSKKDAEILFVAPKIHKKDWPLIDQGIKGLQNELNSLGYGFIFKVICDLSNPDFQTEIMDPVISIVNNVADTNELFVRSVQLLHMFYNCSPKVVAISSGTVVTKPKLISPVKNYQTYTVNGMGPYPKGKVAAEAVRLYSKLYPAKKGVAVVNDWLALNVSVPNFIETQTDFNKRIALSRDPRAANRSEEIQLPCGDLIYVSNQYTLQRILDFMAKVNAQPWGITIA